MSDSANVQDYFTRAASGFASIYLDAGASPVMGAINRMFRRDMYVRFDMTMEHVRSHALRTVLDVGCGPGQYVAALSQLPLDRIVGLDYSPSMIELANETLRGETTVCESIELRHGDFMAYEPAGDFDALVAMGLDYIRDPVDMLRKMRDMSRHSVVASFPSISAYRTPIRKLRYRVKKCPVYFYTRQRIVELAAAAGYGSCDVHKIRGSGQDFFATLWV
jgi:ubiquinone/menaquinone biosynthesis C-methylase UbiE